MTPEVGDILAIPRPTDERIARVYQRREVNETKRVRVPRSET
jgi:hypothetical protein